MNDQDKSNEGLLVPTGHCDLVPAVSANPLVARGAADLARMITPIEMADQVQELPAELVAAWQKAGATFRWMVNSTGLLLREGADRKKYGVPAFYFPKWKAGVVEKLPQPQKAFGLGLGYSQVSDVGLKELAGLKSLQRLELGITRVTDTGLKELAGLKSLQWVGLYGTRVTDAGLKDLAELKSLQVLWLHRTQVTDAGLKELAGLKGLQIMNLEETQVTDAGLKE